jgi:hypothetical protein
MYEFDTIDDFWKLYNNFNLIGGLSGRNYFLMRDGILPTWEDIKNRNGGICSVKLPMTKAEDAWNHLSMSMIGETYYDDNIQMNDINGLSFCPKNIWCIIKIWNADSKNNTSITMPQKYKDRFNKCTIIYKSTKPE